MKRLLTLLCIALTLLACEKDKNAPEFYAKIVKPYFTSTYHEISCSFKVESNGTVKGVAIEYDVDKNFPHYESVVMNEKDGTWSTTLLDLDSNTPYYFRFRMKSPMNNTALADTIITFNTKDYAQPAIGGASVCDTTDVSFTCFFSITETGGLELKATGVCYGTAKSPTKETAKSVLAPKVGSTYVGTIEGLTPNTLYYVRAYAINEKGVTYSDEMTATTYALPQVETGAATDIAFRTAKCAGKLLFNGNTTSIAGICYAIAGEPNIDKYKFIAASIASDGTFQTTLTDLEPETSYTYRAYAQNKIGVAYGEPKTLVTQAPAIPSVKTEQATNVEYITADLNGLIDNDGGADLIDFGFCLDTKTDPTIETAATLDVETLKDGKFSYQCTGLTDATTYYFRAYAINAKGIAYGETKSFKTKEYGIPVVSTVGVASITNEAAVVQGKIVDNGGLKIDQCGICYNTTGNPTIADSKVTATYGETFSATISGLAQKTKYYARAYAINSLGTSYGDVITFTTPGAPTATITGVTVSPASGYFAGLFDYKFTISGEADFSVSEVYTKVDITSETHVNYDTTYKYCHYNQKTPLQLSSTNKQVSNTISLEYSSVTADLYAYETGDDWVVITATFVTSLGNCSAKYSFTTDNSGYYSAP